MNIFAVDRDPRIAARSLSDRHVIKMTLESAQLLSTAAYNLGQTAPYRPTHLHHPCTLWTATCRANWQWLLEHGLALAEEYSRRYGREHKTHAVLRAIAADDRLGPPPSARPRTLFAQAMPDQYKGMDAVAAYRRFYRGQKASFASWKAPARPPDWW